uniref:Uncharacterized protein n=1 Tax=Avena sativa TaxID=4498 RepID=A0ACD5U6E9_AVESA
MDILTNAIQHRKLQIKNARRRASQGGADHSHPPPSVIKGNEQESSGLARSGQDQSDQEEDYMAILTNAVERQKLKIRARRVSGSLDHPAPPPPAQNSPSPPPAAPAPAHRQGTKSQATGPPTGFSGVRQPPPRSHDQPPPRKRGRTPPPPPVNTSTMPPLHPEPVAKPAELGNPSIVCGLCGVQCMTLFNLMQHEKGRKHRNKVAYAAGEMNVQCEVCDVPLLSKVNVQEHYAGKQHLHRVFGSGAGAN